MDGQEVKIGVESRQDRVHLPVLDQVACSGRKKVRPRFCGVSGGQAMEAEAPVLNASKSDHHPGRDTALTHISLHL